MANKSKGGRRAATNLKNRLWRGRSLPQRIVLICLAIILVVYAQGLAVSTWYIHKHADEPLNFGVTFSTNYTNYLGIDPQATFKALRDDMGFKRFRLVTFWENVEPQRGVFDFSDIDWQLAMIKKVDGSATVSLGLRQPRWPECHIAPWAVNEPTNQRDADVNELVKQTVEHLKDNPTVTSYQLENEYFLGAFGACPAANRQQLINEFNLVKQIDPSRPVVMSLANNYFGIPIGQPRADEFGVSVYKRVWDQTVTKRYFEYPFAPKYYAYRAGLTEIFTGKKSMLHELQVEPWTPKGTDLVHSTIAEQNKSMDAGRAQKMINYSVKTGFRDIDLWGGEYWYWRMTTLHDPSVWNAVKATLTADRAKYNAN